MKKIYSKNFQKHTSFILFLFISCFILFSTSFMFLTNAATATDYWSSYQETNFTEGDGTSSSPYVIITPGQLYYFLSQKNGYAKLGTSIDLSAHLWNSPQRYGSSITLDGNGYAITNLKSTSAAAGLIGVSNTTTSIITIKNLTISVNISYNGNSISYTGAFVGGAVGSVILNKCVAYGSISNTSNSSYIGGMVGTATSVTATQCINYININGKAQYAGGIIGYVSNSAIFDTCGNNGTIESTRTSENFVGGIAGQVATVSSLSKCYNSQSLTSSKGYVGGLIGGQTGSTNYTISSVYNTGVITGEYAGGFIGQSNGKVTISYAYNTGNVISKENTSVKYKDVQIDQVINEWSPFELEWSWENQDYAKNSLIPDNYSLSFSKGIEQFGTGGGYYPSNDYDLYAVIKNISYVNYVPNISFVNNSEKFLENVSQNVYSIAPESYKYGQHNDIKFTLGFCGKDGNSYYTRGEFVFSLGGYYNQNIYSFYPRDLEGHRLYINRSQDICIKALNSTWDDVFRDYRVETIQILGVNVQKYNDNITFTPLLYFEYWKKDNFGFDQYKDDLIYPFSDYGTYSYTLPNIPNAPTFYSVNQIKTAELGENFVVDGKINNGLPYLKDFYW
mgnify:CR=1 FL=1